MFSNTVYHIDFYQRDYRWSAEPVSRLLDDIFYKFKEQDEKSKDLDPGKEVITANYPWYYLNTYVTNTVEGRVYVVDGQQRLTTLSLILIKLHHLAIKFNSKLLPWIDTKISGQSGFEQEFWMNHVAHKATQKALFDGISAEKIDTSTGLTAQNMVANYQLISAFLDQELKDSRTFEMFAFYFLHRLVLINLSVEQTDVSMVFEVINDRGIRLRPYEILKGKLLGQINKIELERGDFNGLWEAQAELVNSFKEDEMDNFFRFYLKAKFASTRKDAQRFDGDYHRAMLSITMAEILGLAHSPVRVKEFLKGDFTYYSTLYARIKGAHSRDQKDFREIYFNYLLDLDAPFLLAMSACLPGDPQQDEKIRLLSKEIDRYFCLLQLQNSYDSNEFNDSLFVVSGTIRGQDISTFRKAFDEQLLKAVQARRNAQSVEAFSYSAFKQTGMNLKTGFKRYFFARVDEFLASNMNLNPKHPITDLVTKRGADTGFHVEHILSWNDENVAAFDGDEQRFEQERNRLGAILLLKGKDNISSNNETYQEKLKSYANTLYWNETLRADSYKSKLDMRNLKTRYQLDLEPLEQFGPDQVESRHKLLFKIASIIWA